MSKMDNEPNDLIVNNEMRIEGVSKDNVKLIETLLDKGTVPFIKNCKKDVNYDPLNYLEVFCSQFLSYKGYSE